MIQSERFKIKESGVSQMNAWKVKSSQFVLKDNSKEESLFTIANGFIGLRGDMEEVMDASYSKRGTFINGFYERSTIPYGEVAYGYAKTTQTMLNVADVKQVELCVDGEKFEIETADMEQYSRVLDMEKGILTRSLIWNTAKSGRIEIKTIRFASMKRQNIVAVQYQVTALDRDVKIRITTGIDGSLTTGEESDDPRIAGGLGDGSYGVTAVDMVKSDSGNDFLSLTQKTQNSGFSVTCLSNSIFIYNKNVTFQPVKTYVEKEKINEVYEVTAQPNVTCSLQKIVCYCTDQYVSHETYMQEGLACLEKAIMDEYDCLVQEQIDFYRAFWKEADVSIPGDNMLTQSMRFNMFQLVQSVGRNARSSIAAKGLSGEGYGGHYFWESEAYIMPVFLYTKPEIAKQLLEYRCGILDKAREQARLLGHEKGALYSWRSIDGEECSAYFLGGSSQYHINADVAFGMARYLDATQDEEFLKDKALEVFLETSRLWISVGHYNQRKGGAFCIDGVTGPDEYTAMVNNNFYTNVMARENMWNAVRFAKVVAEKYPNDYKALCDRIGFVEKELDEFQNAADHMYIPYDEAMQIHMQDDTFLDKKVLDLDSIPAENHPLLTHYHPLFIYRHQVCKQADLLLAEFYLPQYFTEEEKRRDYEYYEKVTTHDSSLSASIFSIMGADIGDREKAYQYFIQTVRTDLDDNQRNTKDGLHMANMAGAWSCIVNGFAGFRVSDGVMTFKPILPEKWNGYEFTVHYRGVRLHVTVSAKKVCYELSGNASSVQIRHGDKLITLHEGMNEI